MGSVKLPPHAIIFPFMAQGHTLPLLDFAKILSHKGVKVTIITTASNAKQISSTVSDNFINISTHVIPFPIVGDLPQDCENTKDLTSEEQLLPFLKATTLLKEPFECFLRETMQKDGHPICVVCDVFLGWAIPICSSLNIPGILFHGMGVLPLVIAHLSYSNVECIKGLSNEEELDTLTGLACPFSLARDDFPYLMDSSPVCRFFIENGDDGASSSCWGLLSNSFEELEGEFVGALESSYGNNVNAWCVGPLFLYEQEVNKEKFYHNGNPLKTCSSCDIYQSWLDGKEKESVIYVSFGTQSYISDTQMDKIALGLEMACHQFIWVVRSKSWNPPEGWEERVKGKGLILREWVDQKRILEHQAIGGFLSHCGWNSVLESLSFGVPLLTWPMGADQSLNAKVVTKYLNAGIAISPNKRQDTREDMKFYCDEISTGVKKLMGAESGRLVREKAKDIEKLSRKAVKNDGSSSRKLDQLIECLTEMRR